MSPHRQRQVLSGSCVIALVALALVVWSIVDPRPVPVVIAMSVAQGLGTLSLLLYLLVVVMDLRQKRVLSDAPPEDKEPK
jgi:hypothetical protein